MLELKSFRQGRVAFRLKNFFYLCSSMKNLIAAIIRYVPRKYLQRVGGAGLKVVGWFYRGNKVTCPVCRHQYTKFLPYGRLRPRPNALCPECLSLERHRLIWLYLEQRSDFFRKKLSVLHVAPEACFIKRFEKLHGDSYITADIESPLAKVKMDIHQIPFEDNTFDVILCNHVLEHVRDDIQAMREMCRVLKPGGFAILLVPFYPPLPEKTFEDFSIQNPREREKIFGQDDHVRKYGNDYTTRIAQAGFTPVADPFALEMTDEMANKYSVSRELLYKGIKA